MKLISFARALVPLGLLALPLAVEADTYTVTTVNPNDAGGFLQAVSLANNHPGPDTINFNIPGPGPYTINVITSNGSVVVLDPVTIDGTTQPGYAGTPIIEFRGTTNGSNQSSRFLQIAADDTVIKGVSINGYSSYFLEFSRNNDQVYSCYLGIRPDGTAGGPAESVAVTGQGNALNNARVGAPGQGNYFGGSAGYAVNFLSGANHRVQGNVFGTDVTGVPKLDNNRGVGFTGTCTDSVIGGNAAGEGNKFPFTQNYAIMLSGSRNKAAGNWIGLDVTGTSATTPAVNGTESYGILVQGSGTDNQIGDVGENGRNIINGRTSCIRVMGSTRLKIFNNWCGFNKNGTLLGQSLMSGVFMTAPGGNNTPATSNVSPIIGGEPDWPNVFGQGGNSVTTEVTITAATGAKISSNWFGIAPDGVTTAIMAAGLSMNQTVDTVVGGLTFGDRNVFGLGGSDSIISILDTRPVIQGNYIGMNAFGTQALNHSSGINCTGTIAPVIGGPAAGAGNYFAGGTQKGIVLGTTANPVNDGLIQGNFIGFLPDGTKVATGDSSAVVISGVRNRITQNAMYSPNVIGIDLGDNNRTNNDAGDPDTGPNNLQNYPVITTAGKIGNGLRVIGTLNSAANSAYTLEFYASTAVGSQSMGERYLGSTSVTTNASGNASFSIDLPSLVALGERITTTATDASGSTSELSAFLPVTNLNVAPVANAGADQTVSIPHDGNPATNTATVTLDGSGSTDANGDTISYQWKLGASVVGTSAQLTVTKPAGSYTYTLTATDPAGLSSTDTVDVTVNAEPNAAPTVNAGSAITVQVAHDGNPATDTAAVSLSGTASDPDGDSLTYEWKRGATVLGTTLNLTVNLQANSYDLTLTAKDAYGATTTSTVHVSVQPENNELPNFSVGPFQATVPHDGNPATNTAVLTLTSVVTDPENDAMTYEWLRADAGPGASLGTTLTTTVTETAGVRQYMLRVTDSYGDIVQHTGQGTVNPEPNEAPTVAPIAPISASVPHDGDPNTNTADVTVSAGQQSDPDGDTLSYKWTDTDGNVVSTVAAWTSHMTPGSHHFTLTITDPYGASGSQVVTVTVTAESNSAPSADAGADQTVSIPHDGDPATATASVTLMGTKSDPDGDSVAGSWKDGGGNPVGSGDAATVDLPEGTHTFTYTVTDSYGASSTDSVTVTVGPEPNQPPQPVASDTTATVPHDGDPATNTADVVLEGGGIDPDGDPVTLQWVRDGNVVGTSANLPVTLAPGDYYFTLKVTDSYGETRQFVMLVQVFGEENGAPFVDAGADHSVTVPHDGDPNTNTASDTLTAQATDPEGDAMTFEWKDENGNVLGSSLSVSVQLAPGDHAITFTATDVYGKSRSATVNVHVDGETNAAPSVDAGNDQTLAIPHDGNPATDSVQVTLSATGSDPDGDSLSYEWYEGATLRGSTAVLSVACTAGQHTFTVRVKDAYGNTSEDTVVVTVAGEPNGSPVAIIGPDFTVKTAAGQTTATFQLDGSSSTDPDNDTLSYQWSLGGQPVGSNAHLSATQPVGVYTYTLEVTDPYGAKSTKTVTVTVELGNQAPTAVAGNAQTVTVQHDGDPATNTASVTLNGAASSDPDGQTLTYEWKNGNGAVVGTTATVSLSLPQGSHAFTLKVTDPFGASNASTVSVTVLPEQNGGPSVTAGPNQTVPASASGTATVTVTAVSSDPDGDTLSLKWYEGATLLGSGSSLTKTLSAGSHALTVVATDPYGLTASSTVVVSVQYAGTFFLQPINNDNSSIFKQGSTVPVKFSLSSGATNVVARIYIAKVTNDIVGTEMEPISTSAADTGNLFRYSGGIYIFNLNTKNLTSGTYQVRADLGDGALHTVLISLKP